MAITIREEQDAGSNISAISFTLGAGTQVGDTILLVQANAWYSLANLQTPTGTAVANWGTVKHTMDGGTDDNHVKVWMGAVTTGGTSTVIVNNSTTDEERFAAVFVLAGAIDFDSAASTDSDAAATSHVAPTVTPTAGKTDDLLVCLFGTHTGGSINYTMPGSMTAYTERDVGAVNTFRAASEQLVSDAATGTRTATSSVSVTWFATSVLVKVAVPAEGGMHNSAAIDRMGLNLAY